MRHLGWALAAFLLLTSSVHSATVHITPRITAVLNEDFTPVSYVRRLPSRPGYYLIQVEVDIKIDGLGGDAVGFSNTAFNVFANPSIYSDVDLGVNAWSADNPQFDSNGPGQDGVVNVWDINADAGVNKNDLRAVVLAGITKSFGPPPFDIRRTLAQDEDGDHAGTFYMKLPGTRGNYGFAEIHAPFGASTYDANGVSSTAGNEAVGGRTNTIYIMPEPTSLALLGLGSALLLALARQRCAARA